MTHLDPWLNLATISSASPSRRYYDGLQLAMLILYQPCQCQLACLSGMSMPPQWHPWRTATLLPATPHGLEVQRKISVSLPTALRASIHTHFLTGWFSIIHCILDFVLLKHNWCCHYNGYVFFEKQSFLSFYSLSNLCMFNSISPNHSNKTRNSLEALSGKDCSRWKVYPSELFCFISDNVFSWPPFSQPNLTSRLNFADNQLPTHRCFHFIIIVSPATQTFTNNSKIKQFPILKKKNYTLYL